MLKDVSLEIIQQCPNMCIQCSSMSSPNAKEKIPFEKIKEIVDSLERNNIDRLSISGGEPFLHEDLIKIIQYTSYKNIGMSIYTSGIKFNNNGKAKNLDFELLKEIKSFGVTKIMFDIPAIDEELYNTIMGTNGHYQYALESLFNAKEAGLFTEIHFVPMKININQIEKLLKFSKKQNIDQVSFLRLVMQGRAKNNKDLIELSNSQIEKLKENLSEFKNKYNFIRIGTPLQNISNKCSAGLHKMCIKYDGSVSGCEAFKELVFNNHNGTCISPDSIYDKDISHIISYSEFLNAERDFVAEFSGKNENCPVQKYLELKRG